MCFLGQYIYCALHFFSQKDYLMRYIFHICDNISSFIIYNRTSGACTVTLLLLSGKLQYSLVHSPYLDYAGLGIVHRFVYRMAVFTANSDRQWWARFSIGVYGSKTIFSLSYFRYWSNVKTVSEKSFV